MHAAACRVKLSRVQHLQVQAHSSKLPLSGCVYTMRRGKLHWNQVICLTADSQEARLLMDISSADKNIAKALLLWKGRLPFEQDDGDDVPRYMTSA